MNDFKVGDRVRWSGSPSTNGVIVERATIPSYPPNSDAWLVEWNLDVGLRRLAYAESFLVCISPYTDVYGEIHYEE